jgi:hypothetical protein
MSRILKKLSLDETAFKWAGYLHARRGSSHQDYYALARDDTDELRRLLRRTRWTQGPSSRSTGRSKLYAFHLALTQAFERKHGGHTGARDSGRLSASERNRAKRLEVQGMIYGFSDLSDADRALVKKLRAGRAKAGTTRRVRRSRG